MLYAPDVGGCSTKIDEKMSVLRFSEMVFLFYTRRFSGGAISGFSNLVDLVLFFVFVQLLRCAVVPCHYALEERALDLTLSWRYKGCTIRGILSL